MHTADKVLNLRILLPDQRNPFQYELGPVDQFQFGLMQEFANLPEAFVRLIDLHRDARSTVSLLNFWSGVVIKDWGRQLQPI
jgi:hypothetical protein